MVRARPLGGSSFSLSQLKAEGRACRRAKSCQFLELESTLAIENLGARESIGNGIRRGRNKEEM
jgi:hypothetical protein